MELLQRLFDDTSLLLGISASALVLYITYYNFKKYSFWSSRGIKGPTPLPFLGTTSYYFFTNKILQDQIWNNQYGQVHGVYEGFDPVLRVYDPELLKFIYVKNFDSFTDRNYHRTHDSHLKKWLFWTSGAYWSTQRALITPQFSSKKMKTMFGNMVEAGVTFGRQIEARFSEFRKQEASVGREDLMSLTLDVLSRGLFGIKINTYQNEDSEFNKRAFAFTRFDVPWFILWSCIPRSICRRFEIDITRQSKYEYFEKLSQTVIDQRRKDTSVKRGDIIQTLIDAKIPAKGQDKQTAEGDFDNEDDLYSHYNAKIGQDELKQTYKKQLEQVLFQSFDDDEIKAQMTFFFIAGFDTTSSSLSFCILELAHNQEIQQELFEEIQAAFGGEPIDYTKLQALRKLDATINEALRLYSPVTENQRMVTAKDGVVLPCDPPIWLPKGTVISTNWFVTQRDPRYWKNPLKFDITRFYPENRDLIVSCSYGPFGLGPRNCAGMKFAIMSLKVSLTNLLLKFKIKPGPKSAKYPPEFKQHAFFTQLDQFDIIAEARS